MLVVERKMIFIPEPRESELTVSLASTPTRVAHVRVSAALSPSRVLSESPGATEVMSLLNVPGDSRVPWLRHRLLPNYFLDIGWEEVLSWRWLGNVLYPLVHYWYF